ncbi:MAG: hypothetical protein ACHQ51_05330 [Elusimicrobiota bacterium]
MKSSKQLIVLAALAGALAAPCVWAAGPKTSTNSVIVDDLLTGAAGTVHATTVGGSELDGSVGQVSEIVELSAGATVEAGYFAALVSTPNSPSYLQVNGSSVALQWLDAIPANPSGTAYALDFSTSPVFGGILVSTNAYGLSGIVTGLTGNTTYFGRISAAYSESDNSTPVGLGQTVTQALAPSFGAFSDVAPFTLKTAWDSLGNNVGDLNPAWTTLTSTLPAVRQGQAMVYYGGRLYVSGGADPAAQSTVYTAPVLADGTVGAWTTTTPLPGIRESHAMAAWAGRLYVAGGSNGSAQSTVWWAPIRSDGSLGDWNTATPLPSARTQLAMTASAGRLVVTGGQNGISAQSTVYSAALNDDGTIGAWAAAPSLPTSVSGHAMAVSSNTIYIAGGASGVVLNTVWWAPLTAGVPGAWTATTQLPTTLTRHGMAALNGKLYVTGGNDGATVQNATYVGQINPDQTIAGWTSEGAALPALYLHAMAASMDTLYVSGGSNGTNPVNKILNVSLTGTQSLAELAASVGFAPILASSTWRAGTNFDFSGLTPNTTYFGRVSARNYAGVQTALLPLGSTITLAAVPTTAVSTFTDVEIGSVTFQWTAGGNPAGTEFNAQASTASDFSGTLLTGSWLTSTTTGFSSLSPNTSYYLRVQARNAAHVVSPFAAVGSTYTLAVPPAGTLITASNASGLTLTWGPAANPAGTLFEAQVSSMTTFIPLLQSSVAVSLSATFSGLISASTFYARVRALNGNGVPSGFDVTASTATGLDSVAPGIATGTFAYPGAAADTLVAAWVVPGDNAYSGTLFAGTQFLIQWSTSDPAGVAWSTASAQVSLSTGPINPGSLATVAVSALPDRKQVFFREWTRDLAGNYSVPSATFSAITTPFTYEFLAGGGGFDAGTFPSLATDRAGNLQAAYRGTTGTQELQYVKRTAGAWGGPVTVDPGTVVTNPVLALDSSDNPVIAYFDSSATQLKVARFSGSWTISVIEAGNFVPGGAVVDAAGAVNVSYYDSVAGHLKFARFTGVSWSTQTVDNTPANTGSQSALALDATQQAYISYYDATNAALKFASSTAGGGWSLQTVDAGISLSSGSVIAVDGNAKAHIAYADMTGGAVKYASMTAAGWSVRVVEPGANLGGMRVSLALDGAGAANISYGDRTAASLKFAQWTGTAFSTQTVDSAADEGLESSLSLDAAGNVHIAYRDSTDKAFKAAHWTGAGLPGAFGGNARGRAQAASAMSGAALSVTSIQWSWNDNANNELGFRLYGSLVSTGPFVLVADTGTIAASPGVGGVRSYTETGLTSGTTYYRYAVAVGTGGFAASGVAAAFPANVSDTTPPTIVNNQTGDAVLRRQNTGTYNVNFFDSGGSHLSSFAVKASTMPGGVGPDLIAYTTVVSGLSSDSYTAPWPLPAAVFNALQGGVTNYITIKVVDGAGNATIGTDLFYVQRDTSVPSISGHVVEVSSVGITAVEVDCFDASGALQATAFTQADGSGTYVASGMPLGTYRVQATWTVNGVGNSVSIDSIPVDTTSLDFTLQLNYNLAAVQGSLQTLSTNPSGPSLLSVGTRAAFFDPKTVPNPTLARVELYQNNRQVGMVLVPPSGHWIIPNLLPGKYSLRAYNGLDYTEFQEVELIDGEVKTIGFLSSPLPDTQVFAFPNPARRATSFRFQSALLPLDAQIRVFDIAGNLVKELTTAAGEIVMAPGSGAGVYHGDWDLTNSRGQGVASGVYIFSVKVSGGNNQSALVTKKLAVVK